MTMLSCISSRCIAQSSLSRFRLVRPNVQLLRSYVTKSTNTNLGDIARHHQENKVDLSDVPSQLEIKVPRPARRFDESIETKRARLLYSSRKRGIRETDLLLSTFAEKHLGNMTVAELDLYDNLMYENDWDIYYWCVGSKTPPPEYANSSVMKMLQEHSLNKSKQVLRMPDL